MKNKEWLKNITPKDLDLSGNVLLMLDGSVLMLFEDYYWLIKQAERAQELEQQNKRYREALTFYAEKSNYDYDVKVDSIGYIGDQSDMKFYRLDSKILNDKGERARKALEDEE